MLPLGRAEVGEVIAVCKEVCIHAVYDPDRDYFELFLLPGWFLSGFAARDVQELRALLENAKRSMLRGALGL
jgi:hypothetical protein